MSYKNLLAEIQVGSHAPSPANCLQLTSPLERAGAEGRSRCVCGGAGGPGAGTGSSGRRASARGSRQQHVVLLLLLRSTSITAHVHTSYYTSLHGPVSDRGKVLTLTTKTMHTVRTQGHHAVPAAQTRPQRHTLPYGAPASRSDDRGEVLVESLRVGLGSLWWLRQAHLPVLEDRRWH